MLMLMCDSLKIITTSVICWTVKGRAIIERNKDESSRSSSLTVLHVHTAHVPVRCSSKDKIVDSNVFHSNSHFVEIL